MYLQQNELDDVAHFMRTFKQPFPIGNPRRNDWLKEELCELVRADYDGDIVGTIDAITDIKYIYYGMMLETDINIVDKHFPKIPAYLRAYVEWHQDGMANMEVGHNTCDGVEDAAWKIVHNCNMRKLWTVDEVEVYSGEDGVIVQQSDNDPGLFIVTRNGKVVKPPGWVGPEAQLKELVKEVL